MTAHMTDTRDLQHNINPAIGLMSLNQADGEPIAWDHLTECIDKAAADFIVTNSASLNLRPMVAAGIGSYMYPAAAKVLANDRSNVDDSGVGLATAFRAAAFAALDMIRTLAEVVPKDAPATEPVAEPTPELAPVPAQLWTLTDEENWNKTTGAPFTMTGSMAELATYLTGTDLQGHDQTTMQQIATQMAGLGILTVDSINFLSECGIDITLNLR